MPTYVFKCHKCGNQLEQLMSMKEYVQTPAPMCCESGCDGQQRMTVQLQAVASVLKGTGWTPRFEGGLARGPSTDLLIPKKRTTAKRGK